MDQPRAHNQTNPQPKNFFLPRKVFLYLTKKNVLPKKFSSYQKASKKHFFVAPLLNQPGTTKEISRGEKIYYTCLKPIFCQKINFCYLAHSKKNFFFFSDSLKEPMTHLTQKFLVLTPPKKILNNKKDNPNRFILFLTEYSGR